MSSGGMTVLEFAEKKYRECCEKDWYEDARYWSAYLDGARAATAEQRKEQKEKMRCKVQLDKGARMPQKAHEPDAGFDLYAPKSVTVWANYSVVIDTGVHIEIPRGMCGMLMSKSGLNVNHDIVNTGLIDSGYTGSIKVKLYNHGDEDYTIKAGDKISQIVIVPIAAPELTEVAALPGKTERGNGGFGSTGR